MLTAQVLVAAGYPVLMAHVPQPGPQPGAILQWEPAKTVGLQGQQYQVQSQPSEDMHTQRSLGSQPVSLGQKLTLPPTQSLPTTNPHPILQLHLLFFF